MWEMLRSIFLVIYAYSAQTQRSTRDLQDMWPIVSYGKQFVQTCIQGPVPACDAHGAVFSARGAHALCQEALYSGEHPIRRLRVSQTAEIPPKTSSDLFLPRRMGQIKTDKT